MNVVMEPACGDEHLERVVALLDSMGAVGRVCGGAGQRVVEVLAANGSIDRAVLERSPMVAAVVDAPGPILATRRQPDGRPREIPISPTVSIGGRALGVIAGPCSVESERQLLDIAAAVADAGAIALRGGAFKPRTSPYSFQGHGEHGLEILARAREETGLPIVTEVMTNQDLEICGRYADVLQIGSRNMDNTALLTAAGWQPKPVLLKRGWSATLEEYLLAAEYILMGGNRNVILCERGIRTHERYVRNTLALSVVPELKHRTCLPILVDPSHGTGRAHLVTPMSNAAIACGADGLLVEVHIDPRKAWTDGRQSLDVAQFRSLMRGLRAFASAAGRELHGQPASVAQENTAPGAEVDRVPQ